MSKFLSAPHRLVETNKTWGIEEYETTHCCLELDFLSSRKLIKTVLEKSACAKKKEEEDGALLTEPGPDEKQFERCLAMLLL